MLIGKLSIESGFSRDTIRYYEKIGLIQASGSVRQANNYKSYSAETLDRLNHIQQLKTAGFTLVEITSLLDSFQHPDHPCTDLPKMLADKATEIEDKIKTLEHYKNTIQRIIKACDSKCSIADGLPNCMRAR